MTRLGTLAPVPSGPESEEQPETGLTTAQIAEAIKVTRQTVLNWKDRGLLPAPTVLHLGARGKSSVWPGFALPLARYVADALQARRSVAQVARQVRPLLEREAAWVDAEIASGKTIAGLLRELSIEKA